MLGAAAATALAVALRWNRVLLDAGLFGFNGAMVGLAWPSLFPVRSAAFWLVVPAALAATWLHGRLLPALTRRELPVLSVPFVLVVWAAQLAAWALGAPRAPIVPPAVVGVQAGWTSPGLVSLVLGHVAWSLPGAAAIGIGLATASSTGLAVAIGGLLAGGAAAVVLGGLAGALWVGAYAYTATPLALGLGAIFLPATARSLAFAGLAAVLAVPVWVAAVHVLGLFGLFPLTAVANGLLLLALLAARSTLGAGLGLTPRPLADAGPWRGVARTVEGPREADVAQLALLLRRSERVVVLSGAGMSTESGIPDYRSALGFWYDANGDDLTYGRFRASARSRRLYWRLHRRFARVAARARPNAGHELLAALDRDGKLQGIVTQNVDGLHQRAGVAADHVIELHGTAGAIVCLECWERTATAPRPPWRCARCGGLLKVDTVSFGEPLDAARLARATEWCRRADLLLVLGTSLQVAPAAGLPELARVRGVPIVVINRTATPLDPWATLVLRGPTAGLLGDTRRRVMQPDPLVIRPMHRVDFHYLCTVVDGWWGDYVRYLLHPLYLEHFPQTCLVAEREGRVAAFLVGFVSQGQPDEAYVHLVGTDPAYRRQGLARALYDRFFALIRSRGCTRVSAVTVPANRDSLAFHRELRFRPRDKGAAWAGDVPYFPDYAGPGVDCVVLEREL